jgi:integrase
VPKQSRQIKPSRLKVLWQAYTEFQRSQLAHSTIERDYRKIARLVERMPEYLDTAIEIRDWMIRQYSGETTRRYLMQLNACCNWAVDSDLLSINPFHRLNRQFKRKQNDTTWVGFTAEERNIIIQTFEEQDPFYAPWVKFLFWTGCRPEEAAALRWEHLDPALTKIRFWQAAPVDTKKTQRTKNHKNRDFPTNQRLINLLNSLRPENYHLSMLVFTGVEGGSFEYHNFQTRHWKPLVEDLVQQGKVAIALSQSHARHTFITLALDHLSVKDVAYLVGNSPDIIYKHYASRSRNLQVPEF